MIKKFLEWISLKEKLHNKQSQPPFANEGEIWWISMGENIGWEINGKKELFTRPVIILKKLAHGFYFVIPLTSQEKEGSWYLPLRYKRKNMRICLQQARSIDYKRMWSKMGEVHQKDFRRIKAGFTQLYG